MAELIESNFDKFDDEVIILGVPMWDYFDKTTVRRDSYVSRQGPYVDVLKKRGTLGYMNSSDNMRFYNEIHPDMKRVPYNVTVKIGGLLPTEENSTRKGGKL